MIPDHQRRLLEILINWKTTDRVILQKGRACGVTTYVKDNPMISNFNCPTEPNRSPLRCPIHGTDYDYDDGGTGCICCSIERPRREEDPALYQEIDIAPIVKNPKPFCNKCGRSHKAQWCT